MKMYGGSECIDPHFPDLGTSWRWVVSFKSPPIYPREITPPRYPFDRRLLIPRADLGLMEERKFF
jgi:hypothetical protein